MLAVGIDMRKHKLIYQSINKISGITITSVTENIGRLSCLNDKVNTTISSMCTCTVGSTQCSGCVVYDSGAMAEYYWKHLFPGVLYTKKVQHTSA